MYYTDNPLADHANYEAEQERKAQKYPKCDICDSRIMDDYVVVINGDLICSDCLEDMKQPIEDFME